MLQNVADRSAELKTRYGNVSAASVGAIQRSLLTLESQGAEKFFGEPMLDVADLMRTDAQGRGIVNVLAADKLMQAPRLYAIFLLWLLGDLYEKLPEVGDMEQPAGLLLRRGPSVVHRCAASPADQDRAGGRLVRSRASGCISSPRTRWTSPIRCWAAGQPRPARAARFTPRDQKAVKTAAQTMRPNPGLDIEAAITELGVGEALVSLLDAKGRPQPTERAWIVPPASRIGPATDAERQALRRANPLSAKYEQAIDRESAYEVLAGRASAPWPEWRRRGRARRAGGRAGAGWRGGRLHAGPERSAVRIDGPRGGKRDGWSRRWPRAPSARSPGTGARHPGIVAWLEGRR